MIVMPARLQVPPLRPRFVLALRPPHRVSIVSADLASGSGSQLPPVRAPEGVPVGVARGGREPPLELEHVFARGGQNAAACATALRGDLRGEAERAEAGGLRRRLDVNAARVDTASTRKGQSSALMGIGRVGIEGRRTPRVRCWRMLQTEVSTSHGEV